MFPLETEIGTLNFEWHMSQNKSILAEIVMGPCDNNIIYAICDGLNDLFPSCPHSEIEMQGNFIAKCSKITL
jgi:hypothetical protein